MSNLYQVMSGDPPWEFKRYSDKGMDRSPENHYQTMTLDDICDIPVASVADKDCALFMWATGPCLEQAFRVGKAWGFTYKTIAFSWVKRSPRNTTYHKGLGYWTMSNVELCLLFTRGTPRRAVKGIPQLIVDDDTMPLFADIVTPVQQHSRKPDESYRRIEKLMGDTSRLELFARRPRPGWTCLGNEIDGKDITQAILDLQVQS